MKRPTPQKAESSALNTRKFTGTDDPRHLRVLNALRIKPQPREAVDTIAGVSNGPDIVMRLRAGGLEIPCDRITVLDRDNRPRRPGIYSLTPHDHYLVTEWLAARAQQGATT